MSGMVTGSLSFQVQDDPLRLVPDTVDKVVVSSLQIICGKGVSDKA